MLRIAEICGQNLQHFDITIIDHVLFSGAPNSWTVTDGFSSTTWAEFFQQCPRLRGLTIMQKNEPHFDRFGAILPSDFETLMISRWGWDYGQASCNAEVTIAKIRQFCEARLYRLKPLKLIFDFGR